MDLEAFYSEMYHRAVGIICRDGCQTDDLIGSDADADTRMGITLLIRPSDEVKRNIEAFLSCLKNIDAEQYYYPASDFHITLLSVISCYEGFNLSGISESAYIEVIDRTLKGLHPFSIQMKGVAASPSCIMVCGYPDSGMLNEIRNNLRAAIQNTSLEQSVDKRYLIQTAHSTVVRFRKELTNKERYLKQLDTFVEKSFGTFNVLSIELVFNNWYQQSSQTQLLHRFDLV